MAAALLITASLLPIRSERDIMNRKGSGLVVGVCLVVGGCSGGGGNSPATSAPTTTSPPVATSGLFDGGNSSAVEPGTYVVDRLEVPIQVTVPAGWTRFETFAISGPNESFMAFFDIVGVSLDSCAWEQNGGPKIIGRTVDDFVTALQAQKNTVATPPEPVEISGYSGTKLAVERPPDVDVTTCDQGARVGWKDRSGNVVPIVDEGLNAVMAFDLDGQRGVITYGSYKPLSDETRAELDAMVASLKIG